jgi:hypothetical protein
MMDGDKPNTPPEVLDATLTARREGALDLPTWTV